jgi:hypothetical protein
MGGSALVGVPRTSVPQGRGDAGDFPPVTVRPSDCLHAEPFGREFGKRPLGDRFRTEPRGTGHYRTSPPSGAYVPLVIAK